MKRQCRLISQILIRQVTGQPAMLFREARLYERTQSTWRNIHPLIEEHEGDVAVSKDCTDNLVLYRQAKLRHEVIS